jgi:hypothetical protein
MPRERRLGARRLQPASDALQTRRPEQLGMQMSVPGTAIEVAVARQHDGGAVDASAGDERRGVATSVVGACWREASKCQ